MGGYYLGVDTGATKSEALLADGQGRAVGYGRSGPGNWESVGWAETRAVLRRVISQAARMAGIDAAAISAAGLGLAGYDWPEDYAPHEAICRELGLRGPLALVNDAFLGLVAGSEAGWGIVVSAGTSCNCCGRDRAGRLGRLTGSSFFGEYAGAEELVHHALKMVSRAWSQRGPQTALSAAFTDAAGAVDAADLFAGLMRGRYSLDARHAHLVFEAAQAGDEAAVQAVDWAGRQLGDLALGVLRQLDLGDQRFEIVLSGSFFKGSERLAHLIQEVVTAEAPWATIRRLTVPPVAGGVLLAMEADAALTPERRRILLDSMPDVLPD